ncbi:MAG: type II toxin-antitoxin system VapC family toxin [Methanobacteriota archaeon]
MSAFIDAGVLIAAYNTRDQNHERASQLIMSAIKREYGTPYTSDYVFDEAVTLMLTRTKKPEFALGLGEFILGNPANKIPSFTKLLRVDEDIFSASWAIFRKYSAKGLSFTDCTTVSLMNQDRIDVLLSFDRSFDEIVKRVG